MRSLPVFFQQTRTLISCRRGIHVAAAAPSWTTPWRQHWYGQPRRPASTWHAVQILHKLTILRRHSSTRNSNNGRTSRGSSRSSNFQLDALPFSIAPEDATSKFRTWAVQEQGLNWLLSWNQLRISASFIPVWSFDLNLRFVIEHDGRRRLDWRPSALHDAYGRGQSIVHVPGVAAYAGHSYRRSLVNALCNTTLVFLGDETVPFANWMVQDMRLSNGATLSVYPDPWNTTQGRCLQLVKEDWQRLARAEREDVTVQFEVMSARRVYLPIYVFDYRVLGVEYRAFTSGCDAQADVVGPSHQLWGQTSTETSQNVMGQALSGAQVLSRLLGGRQLGILIVSAAQLAGGLLARVLLRLPLISAIAGVFVGFRKILQPWYLNYTDAAAWERQREHEAQMDEHDKLDHRDDFSDVGGTARRYFHANKQRILRTLSGDNAQERQRQADFDWYQQWEQWARQQGEQQQQEQQRQQQNQYGGQQQQSSQHQQRSGPSRQSYQWPFNPGDPYAVLGISRGVSKSEVSAAFRREMLKWHPDTQVNASEADKAKATERSKLISEAYRKIKSEMK